MKDTAVTHNYGPKLEVIVILGEDGSALAYRGKHPKLAVPPRIAKNLKHTVIQARES